MIARCDLVKRFEDPDRLQDLPKQTDNKKSTEINDPTKMLAEEINLEKLGVDSKEEEELDERNIMSFDPERTKVEFYGNTGTVEVKKFKTPPRQDPKVVLDVSLNQGGRNVFSLSEDQEFQVPEEHWKVAALSLGSESISWDLILHRVEPESAEDQKPDLEEESPL